MSATICYALIARRDIILCDHRKKLVGNFDSTCQDVLSQVMSTSYNNKFSYDHGKYTYHAYVNEGLIYICVTDVMFDKNVAFNCLFELEQQFISAGLKERAQTAGLYSLRTAFGSTMGSILTKYSSKDRLGRLESHVEDVTGVMRQNIDKVVERGDALDNLNERSDLLAHSATDFRQSAHKLRKKLCWRNVKLWVILIICVLVLILVISLIVVGVLGAKGEFKKDSN